MLSNVVFLKSSAQTTAKKAAVAATKSGRYLYVATPGIRNYLGYGGHGILVFDIENNHRFVKRIKTQGFLEGTQGATSPAPNGIPSNVKVVTIT